MTQRSHEDSLDVPHPASLAVAIALSVILAIILAAYYAQGSGGKPTMITNLVEVATGIAWACWAIALIIDRAVQRAVSKLIDPQVTPEQQQEVLDTIRHIRPR